MNLKKRNIISAVIAAVMAVSFFYILHRIENLNTKTIDCVNVGFIYDGDASTPYSANFINAAKQLSAFYGDKVDIVEEHNVPDEDCEEVIDKFAEKGCHIIFTNSYGYQETAKKMSEKYPDIEFCAATGDNTDSDHPNYHTFMGEIYQGRYVSGIIAGLKLKEEINKGIISEKQAVVGYVAAYSCPEVISGYTAFLLGVRSQCPNATMRVRYIDTWNNFSLEKETAEKLISEGCVIISHHTNTIGSALACEEADRPYPVYHIGYNQDMMSIAPTVSLTSTRIDWSPYFISAVEAVMQHKDIEKCTEGIINGNDVSGGFREGWVKILDINNAAATPGSRKLIKKAVEDMSAGKIHVFKGKYKGTDPNDPNDTCDLSTEYMENASSSAPTFHYILSDIITIET